MLPVPLAKDKAPLNVIMSHLEEHGCENCKRKPTKFAQLSEYRSFVQLDDESNNIVAIKHVCDDCYAVRN